GRDDFQQIHEPPYEQQGQQESDMVVAEEDMFYAEFEVLSDLLSQRNDAARVVEIIRLEAREDDFVFVPIPVERAQYGVGFTQLLEEIESQRHIFRRAQEWIAKRNIDKALTEVALWNCRRG